MLNDLHVIQAGDHGQKNEQDDATHNQIAAEVLLFHAFTPFRFEQFA